MNDLGPGKLNGACGYLSGPMEFVADHGVEWRRKFINLVNEAGLDIDFIDPTNKPGGEEIKIGENKDLQVQLQKSGQFNDLQKYVHSYRRYDLRFVDLSDFLVVVVDPRVPQWGTSNEVYFCEMQHKPMFFICEGGLHNLPRWLFDVVEIGDNGQHTPEKRCNVFESVEDVVNELVLLDNGTIPLNDEWVLIRRYIEMARRRSGKLEKIMPHLEELRGEFPKLVERLWSVLSLET